MYEVGLICGQNNPNWQIYKRDYGRNTITGRVEMHISTTNDLNPLVGYALGASTTLNNGYRKRSDISSDIRMTIIINHQGELHGYIHDTANNMKINAQFKLRLKNPIKSDSRVFIIQAVSFVPDLDETDPRIGDFRNGAEFINIDLYDCLVYNDKSAWGIPIPFSGRTSGSGNAISIYSFFYNNEFGSVDFLGNRESVRIMYK